MGLTLKGKTLFSISQLFPFRADPSLDGPCHSRKQTRSKSSFPLYNGGKTLRCIHSSRPELHIRGGIEDNSEIFFLIFIKHMLWSFIRTISMRRFSWFITKYVFLWRNMTNYPSIIPVTHSHLADWSSGKFSKNQLISMSSLCKACEKLE